MTQEFEKINIIDGLDVYLVPVNLITEKGHGYEGEELEPYYIETIKPSIEKHGIEVPLVLFKLEEGTFGICDGWHRWKLSIELHMEKVPAVIFNSKKDCYPTRHIKW